MSIVQYLARLIAGFSGLILFLYLAGWVEGETLAYTDLKWLAAIYLVSTLVIFANQVKETQ